jgi:hypothetical protein
LFDAPLNCIHKHPSIMFKAGIVASNFLEIKHVIISVKKSHKKIKPAHQHACNIYLEDTTISW